MHLSFRPHHFLCTLNFQGKGYSPSFIKNYTTIVSHLQQYPTSKITITDSLDSICKPCPHHRNNTCDQSVKTTKLDADHRKALKLEGVHAISWQEAKERIKKYMSVQIFHSICATCSWKNLGVCEASLTKFLSEK